MLHDHSTKQVDARRTLTEKIIISQIKNLKRLQEESTNLEVFGNSEPQSAIYSIAQVPSDAIKSTDGEEEEVQEEEGEVTWNHGDDAGIQVRRKRLHNSDDDSESSVDGSEVDWELPDNNADLDVDVLVSLPYYLRREIVEASRKKERSLKRSTYMPVMDNPELYSQTQLVNFLRSRYKIPLLSSHIYYRYIKD